jgi:hypothetical protein
MRIVFSFSVMYMFNLNSELFPSKIRILTLGSSFFFAKLVLAIIALIPTSIFSVDLHIIVISLPFSILAFIASFFIILRQKQRIKN